MSSSPTVYLITGANRGLGRALTAAYLKKPDTVVIAAVRNPLDSTSQSLSSLPTDSTSKLLLITIDSVIFSSAATAIKALEIEHNITALDVVIANAGIAKIFPTVAALKVDDLQEHINVNVYGVLALYQAVLPLLKKSTKRPKFVSMSTGASTIADMEKVPIPNAAYSSSKAMLNWLTRKMHFENDWLTVLALHPGWVQTEMGNTGAVAFGMEKAEITIEESIQGMVPVIDSASRDTTSGKFVVYDGKVMSW